MIYDRIHLKIEEDKISLALSEDKIKLDLKDAIIVHPDYETYTGATEITPSLEEQVLSTGNKVVLKNIVIHKIPSNYGLITYNGSILTVS